MGFSSYTSIVEEMLIGGIEKKWFNGEFRLAQIVCLIYWISSSKNLVYYSQYNVDHGNSELANWLPTFVNYYHDHI